MGEPIKEYVDTIHTFPYGSAQEQPKGNEMNVLVRENGEVEAVDFLCPCSCQRSCYTPVTDATKGQPKTDHHWLYSRGPSGKVTLTPSIRYLSGCRAHFNITDGKVIMHADSGETFMIHDVWAIIGDNDKGEPVIVAGYTNQHDANITLEILKHHEHHSLTMKKDELKSAKLLKNLRIEEALY